MADDPNGGQPMLLATAPAQRSDWHLAIFAVTLLSAIFAMALPFARVQLAPLPAFLPAYWTALVITNLLIAGLLLAQFNINRSRALLVLGCGYLFAGALVVLQALVPSELEFGSLARCADPPLAPSVLARRLPACRRGLCAA